MIKNTRATTLQGAEEYIAILVKILKDELTKKGTPKQTIIVQENGEATTIDDFYAGNNPPFVTNDLGKAFRFKVWVSRGRQKTFYKAILSTPEPVSDAELEREPNLRSVTAPAGGVPTEEKVDWDAKELREKRSYALRDATQLTCILAEFFEKFDVSKEQIVEMAEFFVNYIYHGKDYAKVSEEAEKLAGGLHRADPPPEDVPW